MMATGTGEGEGKQTQLLRLVLRRGMEDMTESMPIAEWIGETPNVGKKKVVGYSKRFKTAFDKRLENVVESLFQDENFDELLKSRHKLIEEQKDMEGCTVWRPSGSVVDDMRSFNMNIITAKGKQATVMCEKVEQEVETLFSQVQEARSKALHYQKQLCAADDQAKKLFEVLNIQEEALLRIAGSLMIT